MDQDECYRILGLMPGVSRAELKKAFRRLALMCSPDRHPGDEALAARYREIVAAYHALSAAADPRERDLDAAEERPKVRAFKSFADLFSAYEAPGDVRCEVHLTRKEAKRGVEKMIRFDRSAVCEACGGRGGESPCGKCGGAGKIKEEVEVRLHVPPGVQDGARIRLRREGDLSKKGGERGDVYCRVRVAG